MTQRKQFFPVRFLPTPPSQRRSGEHAVMRSGEYKSVRQDDDTVLSSREHELPAPEPRVCDTVRLRGDRGEGVVLLVEGEVAWVTTAGFGVPSFARRLLDDGHITSVELEMVVTLCQAEKLNFAETLLRLDLVDADLLRSLLEAYVKEQMKALLSLREVSGAWERSSLRFSGDLTVPLDDVLSLDELERWGMIIAHSGGALGERRCDERFVLHALASVASRRGTLLMMTDNISRTGALLRSPSILEPGDAIEVRLAVGEEKFVLPAVVVRFQGTGAQSIAVRWKNLTTAQRDALERLIATL